MRATRKGAERNQYTDLRTTVRLADVAMAAHLKQCARCIHAKGNVAARCEVWWNLARNLHRTRRRLASFEHAPNPDQQVLPGMEEL